MANEYGKDWRIKVKVGSDFEFLGGEGSWDFKRQSDSIDLSSKDDGSYKSMSFGQQAITISVNGNVKLPDEGLEAIFDIAKAAPPEIEIQLVKGAIIKYHGLMGVGNQGNAGPKDGAVTYSFDFTACAAPTVDDLGATA